MATNAYVGASGKARKVKNIYVGVGGKARKVLKAYVGVNGKARLCYQALTAWERYSVNNKINETQVAYSSGEQVFARNTQVINNMPFGTSIAVDNTGSLYIPSAEIVNSYRNGDYRYTQDAYIQVRDEFYHITSTSKNAIVYFIDYRGEYYVSYSASGSTHRQGVWLLSVSQTQGSLIDTVYAEEGTYPDNGVQDGYWYVKVS